MLRKLLLVFFGFVAIVLAGHMLAIMAVVLFIAVVGFLFWQPLCGLCTGLRASCQPVMANARAGWRQLYDRVRPMARSFLSNHGYEVLQRLRDTAWKTIATIGEILSGAVVGGFVVYLAQREHSYSPLDPPLAEITGALVGGLIGLLVALAHWRSARQRTLRQLPDGLE